MVKEKGWVRMMITWREMFKYLQNKHFFILFITTLVSWYLYMEYFMPKLNYRILFFPTYFLGIISGCFLFNLVKNKKNKENSIKA